MRIALLSDIHGNLIALEAVLADLQRDSVEGGVFLGDAAATGPRPRECIALLCDLGWACVMGNADAELLNPQPYTGDLDAYRRFTDIDGWCAAQLTTDECDALLAYTPTVAVSLEDDRALLAYHGSPRSYNDVLAMSTPDEQLAAYFEGMSALIYAGGHTHQVMLRRWGQAFIINPGSVGLAWEYVPSAGEKRNRPHAEYAVLDTANGHVRVEFRRVPYDGAAVVHDATAQGMPHAAWWGRHLTT